MKRMVLTVIVITYVLFAPLKSYPFTQIYNEQNGLIYLGGEPLEMKRFELDKLRPKLSRNIFAINVKDNTSKFIIETTGPVYMYEVSRKGYIAVSMAVPDGKARKSVLIIYDAKGAKLKEIENVPALLEHKFFSWNDDGSKIAYVTGVNTPEDREPFRPKGAWIYDVEQNKASQISEKGVQVNWSNHNHNIYLQGGFIDTQYISMYSTATDEIKKVNKKGLIFSFDGKYYVGSESKWYPDKGTVTKHYIFNNKSDEIYYQFKIGEDGKVNEEWLEFAKFIDKSHYLILWDNGGFYGLFNADTKSFIRRGRNRLLGWNHDTTKIVVYEKGGKQVYIEDSMTGKRLQSINIPE